MELANKILRILAPAGLLALAGVMLAGAQEQGQGALQVVSGGSASELLPLKHTAVKAEISGFVAEVSVTQVFGNPSEEPIEAVYVFPLPENSAVNEMTLSVADRTVKGYIKKREEARQVYEQARSQGRTAALLDQERPNIFTQSVANIPPGGEIRVTIRYIQNLAYDDGKYKFTFPMTVGPRYIPGVPAGRTGHGWAQDTAQVPDASRITPPVVKPGKRSGRDIALELKLNAGVPVKDISSASHEIILRNLGPSRAEVALSTGDSIPNKDFVLTYAPAVKAVDAAVLANKEGRDGYLTLLVQPDADFPLAGVTAKEIVIAIDVSGSMMGAPVEAAKKTAIKFLEGLNPGDTFQILSFASGNKLHFDKPLENTPANVALGNAVLDTLQGGGGTEMLAAIGSALQFPRDPARMRIVLFMTDGYIGNETQILGFVGENLNGSRIFPLGVGSSPNRYLLEELAQMGKGAVQYVGLHEKPEKVDAIVESLFDRLSRPVLTDIAVNWGGLDVQEVSPAVFQDLYAGQPLRLHARYGKAGSGAVTVTGKMRGKPWKKTISVTLPENEKANGAMGALWARSRIGELERLNYRGENADAREKIIALALEHKLMTRFTSFVAVDETPVKDGAKAPRLVPVESELPEGTRYEGFFSGESAAPGYAALAGSMSPNTHRGGAYGFAKMARPAGAAYAAGAVTGRAVAAAGTTRETKSQAPGTLPGLLFAGTASYAQQLLKAPSPRALRQLLALQDASGAFMEQGGKKAGSAEQALCLLALAKAKAELGGSDAAEALRKAWLALKGGGLDGLAAVRRQLKASAFWSLPEVQKALTEQAKELGALK